MPVGGGRQHKNEEGGGRSYPCVPLLHKIHVKNAFYRQKFISEALKRLKPLEIEFRAVLINNCTPIARRMWKKKMYEVESERTII